MEIRDAIYTVKRDCQDCHKCIRECPVKSIRVQDSIAFIVPEGCIACGNCVLACPQNAKQVRDDLALAKKLLRNGRRVVVSLAPEFVNQCEGATPAQWIHALKLLGFYAVSEMALGAEMVSASVRERMQGAPPRVWISSACPVVVDYIGKYRADCLAHLVPLLSPLLSHCKMLRAHYGDEIGIVYVGSCIAKKNEAEQHPELLDVALTFAEMERWLAEEGLRLKTMLPTAADHFEPVEAREGALCAIEGGMSRGIAGQDGIDTLQCMAFSGLANIEQALRGIGDWRADRNLFFEMSACPGGCINGPMAIRSSSVARRRFEILRSARPAEARRAADIAIAERYEPRPLEIEEYTELQLSEALRTVGKYTAEDELNCGGCGYDSCREFARALIAGNAERMMCAMYTRKLAQQKANALLQRMPSAVVIVDEALKIVECNANFIRLFGGEAAGKTRFEGSALAGIVPCANLFRRVLESGEDIVGHDIRHERRILNTSIFTIEPNAVVGAVFQDITEPAFQKEQIIARARAVIQKNLKTVQQIAYLLGENAADSEIILNSIVRSFSPEDMDEDDGGSHT